MPEGVDFRDLPKDTRARLRTLSKANAEDVGAHLLMAGALLDEDPELAYTHAKVAVARGGRVDVVREAMALTAYATGRYDEALREFRTVRRLNGDNEHMPAMADCERGLGRPERALDLAREPAAATLSRDAAAELDIVVAGARLDLGEYAAAISTLKAIEAPSVEVRDRIDEALADALRAAGRDVEAERVDAARANRAQRRSRDGLEDDEVWVFETVEDEPEDGAPMADPIPTPETNGEHA